MAGKTRIRKQSTLRSGERIRVKFDMRMVSMIQGSYGKYRIIPSSAHPKLNETWECDVMTTWESEDNRNTYPLSATVNLIARVAE